MSRISFQSHLLSHLWIPVFFFSGMDGRALLLMGGFQELFFSWVVYAFCGHEWDGCFIGV